jgi:hypothetical protein
MPAKKFLRLTAGRPAEVAGVVVSAGAANAGDIPALGDDGLLDPSVVPAVAGTVAWWGRVTNGTPLTPSTGTTLTVDRMHYLGAGSFPMPSASANAGKVIAVRTGAMTGTGLAILDAGAGVNIGGQVRYFYLIYKQSAVFVSDGTDWICVQENRAPKFILRAFTNAAQVLVSATTKIVLTPDLEDVECWNSDTFTVPAYGWYRFTLSLRYSGDTLDTRAALYRAGGAIVDGGGTDRGSANVSAMVYCITGETIDMRAIPGGTLNGSGVRNFLAVEWLRGNF